MGCNDGAPVNMAILMNLRLLSFVATDHRPRGDDDDLRLA